MKKTILLCLVLLAVTACTPKVKPEPPLQSKAQVAPPAACQALRQRGGSC